MSIADLQERVAVKGKDPGERGPCYPRAACPSSGRRPAGRNVRSTSALPQGCVLLRGQPDAVQTAQVVGEADERPLPARRYQPAQQQLPEASRLFDLAEGRLGRHLR